MGVAVGSARHRNCLEEGTVCSHQEEGTVCSHQEKGTARSHQEEAENNHQEQLESIFPEEEAGSSSPVVGGHSSHLEDDSVGETLKRSFFGE